MEAEAAAPAANANRYRAVLYGGVVAGTFDLAYAVIANGIRGIEPVRVLQSIETGLRHHPDPFRTSNPEYASPLRSTGCEDYRQ